MRQLFKSYNPVSEAATMEKSKFEYVLYSTYMNRFFRLQQGFIIADLSYSKDSKFKQKAYRASFLRKFTFVLGFALSAIPGNPRKK